MTADWIGINSSHLDSHCGEEVDRTLVDALDGLDFWYHTTNEVHEFVLDLGVSYDITKVQGRSEASSRDPQDVDIYISDDTGDWGAAVASGINTWKDTDTWVEVDTTDKRGRYVKVVINDTEDGNRELAWGKAGSPFTIFDVYGEVAADWIGIDSSHIDSLCGEEVGKTLANALDGTDYWEHILNHVHWFVIDLGTVYNVQKVRSRSEQTNDPIDVNIYVNNTGSAPWGDAVASGITTWQDTGIWQEVDTTDKEGRYVLVEIVDTEDADNYIRFGRKSGIEPFFDIYGKEIIAALDLAGTISAESSVSGNVDITVALAGLVEAQSAASASLQLLKELAGSIAAQSDLTGDIRSVLVYNLAGLIEAQSSVAGSILSTESLAGQVAGQSTVAGNLKTIEILKGQIAAQAALTAKLRDLSSLSGSLASQSTVAGNLIEVITYLLSGTVSVQSGVSANLIQIYGEIPPFMLKDLIDPYSGGAWLWLARIVVPTQTTQRIAKNTEDVKYGGKDFIKSNFELSAQKLSSDASIPQIVLRVAQDNDRTLENIVNATKGGEGGTVTIIRTCEKYLDDPVQSLQSDYDILTAGSDSAFVTIILGMPNPLLQRIPLWSYSSKTCELATPSLFKGVRCQYVGGDATCTGLFEDCFTKGNIVHWGAEIGLDPNAVRV